jgi:hypothetical protein
MQLQVYIDTNVYLGLLATEPTVTTEMTKFLALCQNGSIQLLLPKQTEEEFCANREDVVAGTLKALQASASVGGFPPLAQNHELAGDMSQLRGELARKLKSIESWYGEAAKKRELPFDGWFKEIKASSVSVASTPEVVTKATHRAAMHMPPGKDETLGDRLIWECLLKEGEFGGNLHLITDDRADYRCPLNDSQVRQRLQDEWRDVNWGDVTLYSSLKGFFELASETELFQVAADIGRAIWQLKNQSDDASIELASQVILHNIVRLSLRQVRLIASAAREYYDRVFITEPTFDRMCAEFYRHYAKHLTKEEEARIRPVAAATEDLAHAVAANAN